MALSQESLRAYGRFAIWLELAGAWLLLWGSLADRAVVARFYAGLPFFYGYEPLRVLGVPYWLVAMVALVAANLLIVWNKKEIMTRFTDRWWSWLYPGPRPTLVSAAIVVLAIALYLVVGIFA